MSLLTAVLPALLPAAADGVRAIVNRMTGGKGAAPATVEQAVQLMRAENERLQILAQLDQPGTRVYAWVESARALQRPALATWILAAYVLAVFTGKPPETVDGLREGALMVTFYLFGHWGYSGIKAR